MCFFSSNVIVITLIDQLLIFIYFPIPYKIVIVQWKIGEYLITLPETNIAPENRPPQ